jgi:lipid-A-disaccharide synthase
MRLFLIAGEDSGDLHTANLVRALRAARPDWQFRGVGGDHLADAGMELIAHVRDINFMGFVEVVKHLGTIRELFSRVKKDAASWQPDAVVLTDYPGFNLRIAKHFHQQGIPVYYFISPQLWAWKKGRIRSIRAFVRRMFVILPFEEEFYANEGVEVDFVGHPLLDALAAQPPAQPVAGRVALLPGSRKQEIQRMLPPFLAVAARHPELEFVIAGAPSQPEAFYRELIGTVPVTLVMNRTYEVLRSASAALVTSGTATLETALIGVPQVVCYKGSNLSYQIGKRLIKVPFISLVNLILGRALVRECIQHEVEADTLSRELSRILDPATAKEIHAGYEMLRQKLGGAGASARTAELLIQYLES